jgi:3-oxoacyl-[acyl-carrier-protein] synthase II
VIGLASVTTMRVVESRATDIAGMKIIGTVSSRLARPFDRFRDGTNLGLGAGAIVLEAAEVARSHGVATHAVVESCSTRLVHEVSAGSNTSQITACIEDALRQAPWGSIDAVQAHATGTVEGDRAELCALEQVAEAHNWKELPIAMDKVLVGHLMHTSGFFSLVAACSFLSNGLLVTAIPSNAVETSVRLTVVQSNRLVRHEVVLAHSFGFAGTYAALVLSGRQE